MQRSLQVDLGGRYHFDRASIGISCEVAPNCGHDKSIAALEIESWRRTSFPFSCFAKTIRFQAASLGSLTLVRQESDGQTTHFIRCRPLYPLDSLRFVDLLMIPEDEDMKQSRRLKGEVLIRPRVHFC
jgi:hypothetical protein